MIYTTSTFCSADDKTLNALIKNIANKDLTALEQLYKLTNTVIYGFALAVLKNPNDAKTVLLGTYLSIWASAHMYAAETKPFVWLITIAKNHCFKIFRDRKWNKENPTEACDFSASSEENQVLNEFFNSLTDDERQIIMLHTAGGLAQREIAYSLNTPLSAVLSKYKKGLKKLKEYCKKEYNPKSKREIEEKIKAAVEKSTPDVWEEIKRDASNGKGETITVGYNKRKSKWLSVISSIAAALILISAAIFGITNYNRADEKIVSAVYIEVNPEIKLSLNTYNVVLKAEADNEEGKKVLGKMNLKGAQLELAVRSIVSSMIEQGYLNDSSNTVLLSVENDDSVKEKSLYYEVMDNATGAMNSENFNGCAVVQRLSLSDEKEVAELAKRLNISKGKADFIYFFYKNVRATEDELAKLSINDLNLIFEGDYNHEKYKDGDSISYSGSSSAKKYIGIDKLKEIVFKNANVEEKSVKNFDADFDVEKGVMVYEVVFISGSTKYEYEVNAISGEILEKETEEYKESKYGDNTSSKPQINFITGEDALKIALEDAKIKRSEAKNIDAEIDSDDPIKHIDIEFSAGGYDYEYEITSDGKILNKKKELSD